MHRLSVSLLLLAGVLALGTAPAFARDYTLKELRIVEPYSRATPPGARTAGIWFRIENQGSGNDALVGVASPIADSAELHVTRMEGKLAQMRPVNAIGVPARATVTLAPNGYHVMLVGLHEPLAAGAQIPLTLTFSRAGKIEIEADVIALSAPGPAAAGSHSHR